MMSTLSSFDKSKFERFSPLLREWFIKNARDLPWRKTRNPYHILVSEIMAQQTQLKTVIPIYKRFIKRFPTPESLAKASIEEIKIITDNLGYKRRGEYLQQIAQLVITKYNGKIPNTLEELLRLP
ncbi:MAG: A/G-specific adenine glycosylase, partial [Candidatus Hodarchaeota archaeon]